MSELRRLPVPEALRAWLAERERRGKPVLRIDGSKIKAHVISDAEFLASQETLPCPPPRAGRTRGVRVRE